MFQLQLQTRTRFRLIIAVVSVVVVVAITQSRWAVIGGSQYWWYLLYNGRHNCWCGIRCQWQRLWSQIDNCRRLLCRQWSMKIRFITRASIIIRAIQIALMLLLLMMTVEHIIDSCCRPATFLLLTKICNGVGNIFDCLIITSYILNQQTRRWNCKETKLKKL